MEDKDISKDKKNDSSFELDIKEMKDISKNKLYNNSNFTIKQEKKQEKEDINNNFDTKFFEKTDLEDIYEAILLIDEAVKINIDKKNKKDYYNKERHSYTKINENIINEQHEDECKEILSILEKPIRKNIYDTPFKPLKNPKKVSLEGKVLFNSSF